MIFNRSVWSSYFWSKPRLCYLKCFIRTGTFWIIFVLWFNRKVMHLALICIWYRQWFSLFCCTFKQRISNRNCMHCLHVASYQRTLHLLTTHLTCYASQSFFFCVPLLPLFFVTTCPRRFKDHCKDNSIVKLNIY